MTCTAADCRNRVPAGKEWMEDAGGSGKQERDTGRKRDEIYRPAPALGNREIYGGPEAEKSAEK